MEERVIKQISETLNITEKQILTVLALLEVGNTVPFIARYRTEATNGLNDEEIFEINYDPWNFELSLKGYTIEK